MENKYYILLGIILVGTILLMTLTMSYTAPTYSSVNFTLCSDYTIPTYNSINFTLGETDSCITDTCTCAGLNQNWEINLSDYCVITDACDLGTGTLSFTGTGNVTCDAKIDTTNLGDPKDGTLFINNDCHIVVD